MPEPISPRLLETLRFIQKFLDENGKPPTIQEIAGRLRISGPSAFDQVQRLQEAGYIRRQPKRWRSIEVLEIPPSLSVPVKDLVSIPIVGRVAAGRPIFAEENHAGHLTVDSHLVSTKGTLFALKVSGDSMVDADIKEGDYLIVRQQPVANHGDIVVAILGEEGTVKRLKMIDDHIELAPENPRYNSIRVEKGDEFRIVGKALAVYRITKAPEGLLDKRHSSALRN